MEEKKTFKDMHISPKLIKNLRAIGWNTPTEVQETVCPLALAGRDLLVQSVTGSGKTGAFAIPIVDRLLLRGQYKSTSVIILSPTRELAIQTALVIQKICTDMPISCALIVGGGDDFNSQAVLLRNEPDIIIATPGRLIDHLINSSVLMDNVEILVLDEADKLLELGFQNELEKILNYCPQKRQSMLFSATMSTEVSQLATLSLNKPLRVNIDAPKTINPNVQQQFVFTDGELVDKLSILFHLLNNSFSQSKTIVFCENRHQVQTI